MEVVSIWELAANSGISWMSQAPKFHLAKQLLNAVKCNLMGLTTKSARILIVGQLCRDTCMHRDSMCS